jgi:quercetin dioxygenase-like cupin family protein
MPGFHWNPVGASWTSRTQLRSSTPLRASNDYSFLLWGNRRMPASEVSFASAYDEEVGAFSPPSCAGENLTCQLLIVRASKGILIWEEAMTKLTGFGTFAALPDEQLSEKISRRILSGSQGMVVWWSIGAGVHVEPHSHANEQIVWMLKGKMEFRLGSEQRVCSQGDVVVIPGGIEHEAWFGEDTEVIDFFAPPRAEFLLGGKPTYMREDSQTSNQSG